MTDESGHKFRSKYESTYADFLKDIYSSRVALIREFENQIGKKKAHNILKSFYEREAVENIRGLMKGVNKPLESIEDLGRLMKKLATNEFSSNTQTHEYPESDPGTFSMCTRECLWAEVFKELEATDLGYLMFCQTDFAVAPVFHPNIHLERSKTLMQGDDVCDFVYHWKKQM
ncbi:MAG: L-2-amino-thiazoline-4-carboxylic acid hydrolase [Promethearchaeota archaeon]